MLSEFNLTGLSHTALKYWAIWGMSLYQRTPISIDMRHGILTFGLARMSSKLNTLCAVTILGLGALHMRSMKTQLKKAPEKVPIT